MSRLIRPVPTYRKHKASAQAIVALNGKEFYLGPYGTKASKIEYDRLFAEWLAGDLQLPGQYAVIVANRPDRIEPYTCKTRPKDFPTPTEPRAKYKRRKQKKN